MSFVRYNIFKIFIFCLSVPMTSINFLVLLLPNHTLSTALTPSNYWSLHCYYSFVFWDCHINSTFFSNYNPTFTAPLSLYLLYKILESAYSFIYEICWNCDWKYITSRDQFGKKLISLPQNLPIHGHCTSNYFDLLWLRFANVL